jgi:hypothetical protein
VRMEHGLDGPDGFHGSDREKSLIRLIRLIRIIRVPFPLFWL